MIWQSSAGRVSNFRFENFRLKLAYGLAAALLGACPPIARAQIVSGSVKQLSVSTSNGVPSGTSSSPRLAPNGQFSVFSTGADNIVSGDTNGAKDVVLVNLATNQRSLISVASSGTQGSDDSEVPSISPVLMNGFFAVAFESLASDLDASVAFDKIPSRDIFLRLPTIPYTIQVTRTSSSASPNDNSFTPSIAVLDDRILVAFASDGSNLVAGDVNKVRDIYLAQILLPTSFDVFSPTRAITFTQITSIGANGSQLTGPSFAPKFSADGKFIAFLSDASNLVAGRTITTTQVYLYELATGNISLLSAAPDGTPASSTCSSPNLSYTGRYLVYVTSSSNVVPGVSSATPFALRLDRQTGIAVRVSTNAAGLPGNGSVSDVQVSPSGRFVTFSSDAPDLVSSDTNGVSDVFIKDMDTAQLTRVNIGAGGGEANDISNAGVLATSGYNGQSAQVSFFSQATNLSGTSAGSDIYLNSANVTPSSLTKTTVLEVPPDLQIVNRRALFSLREFEGVQLENASALRSASLRSLAAAVLKVRYDIRLQRVDGAKIDKRRYLSKKSAIVTRNLQPGAYTASYRAQSVNGRRRVKSNTGFSPTIQFQVN